VAIELGDPPTTTLRARLGRDPLYPICPDGEQIFVVADGEHPGTRLGGVGGDHVDEGSGGGGVEHGGHLIADQVSRLKNEGAGQAGSLQLAVADFVWPAAEQLGGETGPVGQLPGLALIDRPLASPEWFDDCLAQREPGSTDKRGCWKTTPMAVRCRRGAR
jgi:hypothetical protein